MLFAQNVLDWIVMAVGTLFLVVWLLSVVLLVGTGGFKGVLRLVRWIDGPARGAARIN